MSLFQIASECDQVRLLESGSEADHETSAVELVDEVARLNQPQRMMQSRIHRGKDEGGLLQAGRQGTREQQRILITLILVKVVLRQGDPAEPDRVGLKRQVSHVVDQRQFVLLVVDACAHVHGKFHVVRSRYGVNIG